MSSLPLISHRLFVAAIGSEGNAPAKPSRTESVFSPPAPVAAAISLEVLNAPESAPPGAERRLSRLRDRGSS